MGEKSLDLPLSQGVEAGAAQAVARYSGCGLTGLVGIGPELLCVAPDLGISQAGSSASGPGGLRGIRFIPFCFKIDPELKFF